MVLIEILCRLFVFLDVWMRLYCSRQFVWVRRISRWCIPPSLSSFCCSWSSPVNLLSMERWRPNMWPMPNTTRWVSVLFPTSHGLHFFLICFQDAGSAFVLFVLIMCFMTHHTDIYHHKKTFISVSVSKYDLYSAFWKSVLFGCVYGYFMAFWCGFKTI